MPTPDVNHLRKKISDWWPDLKWSTYAIAVGGGVVAGLGVIALGVDFIGLLLVLAALYVTKHALSRVYACARARGHRGQSPLACFLGAFIIDAPRLVFSDTFGLWYTFEAIFSRARIQPIPTKVKKRKPTTTLEGVEYIARVQPGTALSSAALASNDHRGQLHDAAGAGCKGVRIANLEEGGLVQITFIYWDPFARIKKQLPPLARRHDGQPFAATDITKPLTIGIDVRGRDVKVPLWLHNPLHGGMLNNGKSNIMSIEIAHAALAPNARLSGIDLKGGVEFSVWTDVFDNLATDVAGAVELVDAFHDFCTVRTRQLVQQRILQHQPLADDPAHILFIDEFSRLPEASQNRVFEVMQLGRACSVMVCVATPRPSSKLMNTDLRALMDPRIAVRCQNRQESDMVMGRDFSGHGYDASRLRRQGEFMMCGADTHPLRCLAYYLDYETRAAIAAQVANRPSDETSDRTTSAPAEQDMISGGAPEADGADGVGWTAPDGPGVATIGPPGLDTNQGQAKVWQALLDNPQGLTPTELQVAAGVSRDTVYKATGAWDGAHVKRVHGRWFAATELDDVA